LRVIKENKILIILAVPIQYQISAIFSICVFLNEAILNVTVSLSAQAVQALIIKFLWNTTAAGKYWKREIGKKFVLASDVAESAEKDILHQCVPLALRPTERKTVVPAAAAAAVADKISAQFAKLKQQVRASKQLGSQRNPPLREAASKMTIDKFDTRLFVFFHLASTEREPAGHSHFILSFATSARKKTSRLCRLSCPTHQEANFYIDLRPFLTVLVFHVTALLCAWKVFAVISPSLSFVVCVLPSSAI
jgi:hypothetical protein